LSIFGLSSDSPKLNTDFKEKQKLPYPLLCDPSKTLISAIGMKKAPNNIQRGVFVVDKAGKVLAAEPGGPAATVEVVKKLVASNDAPAADTARVDKVAEEVKTAEDSKADETKPATNGVNGTVTNEDVAKANVAAEVANTAEKLDSNEAPPA
jgi:thioredoxin-dependent peroxiredoxin